MSNISWSQTCCKLWTRCLIFLFLFISPACQGADYPRGLMAHTRLISSGSFSEISTFMPGLKSLMQIATQLRIWWWSLFRKNCFHTKNKLWTSWRTTLILALSRLVLSLPSRVQVVLKLFVNSSHCPVWMGRLIGGCQQEGWRLQCAAVRDENSAASGARRSVPRTVIKKWERPRTRMFLLTAGLRIKRKARTDLIEFRKFNIRIVSLFLGKINYVMCRGSLKPDLTEKNI